MGRPGKCPVLKGALLQLHNTISIQFKLDLRVGNFCASALIECSIVLLALWPKIARLLQFHRSHNNPESISRNPKGVERDRR
jgi:hypothetical protein